ncbi:MAG: cysteine desulfurase [Methylobacterium sp.]|nr:cysteine desulfurase [Methylobacterium sp.]MCA3655905.1 cysteine desulfurase [Methylobacterium sp.]MCA3658308.1 cysteine desulfurase [Methylobacterium sp.]MCA3662081.1 cysteine desulfurase [Methylobacterium sp.]MCA3663321.1 cysteine desulfurase [Methylobacterium sp.]
MAKARAYLDWNATAPLHPAAREAVLRALDTIGNPSSIHAEGRAARALVEEARAGVAALVGGEAENVIFTSGATEAANALLGADQAGFSPIFLCGDDHPPRGAVIYGETEHPCVIAAALRAMNLAGAALPIKPQPDGRISPGALAGMLERARPLQPEGARPLVAIQLANNETGVLQDIPALAETARAGGAIVIVDAAQGPGRVEIDINKLGADALFLSAHKFGGPKGVGAIVFAHGTTRLARAFIPGGGQERGQRGGTENVPGILGMGAAARAAKADFDPETLIELRDRFENHLKTIAPEVRIVGEGVARLPNTSLFAIPGVTAEKALIAFDLAGVAVSSGSACSSGKVKASHVLEAMGEQGWVKAGAIRLSIGPTTTAADIDQALGVVDQLAKREKVKNSASKGAFAVSAA